MQYGHCVCTACVSSIPAIIGKVGGTHLIAVSSTLTWTPNWIRHKRDLLQTPQCYGHVIKMPLTKGQPQD